MRYIEVLAHVRMERQAEGYEAVLELNTTAGKKIACFDQAFVLREAIVGLLKDAGLADSEIREGGGEAANNFWSSTKSVVHRITMRNKSMKILMKAMAATERHFVALPKPFFGGVKHHFTFHTAVPIYSSSTSVDDGLRKAIQDAASTAAIIASAANCRLGQLLTVLEHDSERQNGSPGLPYGSSNALMDDSCLSDVVSHQVIAT